MANRGSTPRIPIWVRLPAIIALVLAGIFMSPMVLDAAGVGVDRGSGPHRLLEDLEMDRDGGGHGSGDDTHGADRDGGDHGSRDETDGMDH